MESNEREKIPRDGGGVGDKSQPGTTKNTSPNTLSTATLVVLATLPLFYLGRWMLGAVILLSATIYMVCLAANTIDEADQLAIRYRVMAAPHLVEELRQQLAAHHNIVASDTASVRRDGNISEKNVRQHAKMVAMCALNALAVKYDTAASSSSSSSAQVNGSPPSSNDRRTEAALSCQDACYIVIRHDLLKHDDAVLSATFALMALAAKIEAVRERHTQQADEFGLDRPLKVMQASLERAKQVTAVPASADHAQAATAERRAAELQRKGCLWLGALADGAPSMARLVGHEGGLVTVLQALDWYRQHEHVISWGLWALFILCYEHDGNKRILLEHSGMSIILQAMTNVLESSDAGRHGLAVLFDILRKDTTNTHEMHPAMLHQAARGCGLHDVVVAVMLRNPHAMDIMTMGKELLMGTEYKGDIPEYIPPIPADKS